MDSQLNQTETDSPIPNNSVYPPAQEAKVNPKKNKYFLPLIATGMVLLLGAGALAMKALDNPKENSGNQTSLPLKPEKESKQAQAQSFAATRTADYGQVCKGGIAANATTYQSGPNPHPIVLFTQSVSDPDNVSQLNLTYDKRAWDPDSKRIETTQLVGCFKSKSLGISKKCEFEKGGKPFLLDYFAVSYELTVREAKTGKVVGTKVVNGPNLTCPSFTSYRDDLKIYAKPDQGLAEEAIREFVLR